MKGFAAGLIALISAVGCGDDGVATDAAPDSTPGDAADSAVVVPVPDPPAAPALPDLLPCPDGWAEIDVTGTPACEPWGLADGPGCMDGEVRFPGDASCAPLGPACPADGVPTDLPAGPVIHVRAESTMGDGSLAAPFGTITEAIAAASPGDVIAVHAGTYAEAIDLSDTGVSVVGACVAETILDAPEGAASEAAVQMSGDVSIARMTIRGGRPGLRAESAGTARVEDVWVEASFIGVVVTQMGTLIADGLVVRDIVPSMRLGYGFFGNAGATLEVRRGDFSNLRGFGLGFNGEGTAVTLEDVAVRNVQQTLEGEIGLPIAAQDSAALTVSRGLIEAGTAAGIFVHDSATSDLEDVVVRDMSPGALDDGFGILSRAAGSVSTSRTRVERATSVGFAALNDGSALTASDIVVHEMRTSLDEDGAGIGVFFDAGATGRIDRVLIHRAAGAAVALTGIDLDVIVRDATVLDTQLDGGGGVTGVGLDVRMEGAGTFERVHIDGAFGSGVVVSGMTARVDATDLAVAGAMPLPSSGLFGRGASIQLGAELTCVRCAFRDSVEAGLLFFGSDGALSHLRVEDTAASDLSGAGMGVVAVTPSLVEIDDFVIQRNALAGVQIADGGEVFLRNGLIADNPVGVNIQDAPPNEAALTDGVIYRDNGINLDAAELPVPEAMPL